MASRRYFSSRRYQQITQSQLKGKLTGWSVLMVLSGLCTLGPVISLSEGEYTSSYIIIALLFGAGTYGCWRKVKKIRRQIQNHKELVEQDAALAQQEADERILQEARRKQAVKEQYLENLRRKCAADSKTAAPAANPDTQKQEMEEAINSLLEDGTLKGMNQSAGADVPSVQKQ